MNLGTVRNRRGILENAVAGVTVLTGAVALVLDQFGLISADATIRVLLVLVALLATSELVEQTRRLNRIEAALAGGFRDMLGRVSHTPALPLDGAEEAHIYLADAISRASSMIRHVAVGPGLARIESRHKQAYHAAIRNMLDQNRVTYRRLLCPRNPGRLAMVAGWMKRPMAKKIFVACYCGDVGPILIPLFVVIDDTEVILRQPNKLGFTDQYVLIRDPELVRYFVRYEENLWDESVKVGSGAIGAAELIAMGEAKGSRAVIPTKQS